MTYAHGVTLDFSRPGKLTDNAFIEAFNSKLRVECLSAHWFMSLEDARQKLEDWRRYYNEVRPHRRIGQIPPILLHNPGGASGPSPALEAENSSFRRGSVWEWSTMADEPQYRYFQSRLDAGPPIAMEYPWKLEVALPF